MKVANGAKAKDRISEHDNGEEWQPPGCEVRAVCLVLEREAVLHSRLFGLAWSAATGSPPTEDTVPQLGPHQDSPM